jgi:hypothetical protein
MHEAPGQQKTWDGTLARQLNITDAITFFAPKCVASIPTLVPYYLLTINRGGYNCQSTWRYQFNTPQTTKFNWQQ